MRGSGLLTGAVLAFVLVTCSPTGPGPVASDGGSPPDGADAAADAAQPCGTSPDATAPDATATDATTGPDATAGDAADLDASDAVADVTDDGVSSDASLADAADAVDATYVDAGTLDATVGDAPAADAAEASTCASPMLTCGTECVDPSTNAQNCGRCNRDCGGTACVAGMCQPLVLASRQGNPWGIAVDGAHVYWTARDDGTVNAAPIAGGPVTTLASGQASPSGIILDLPWTAYGPLNDATNVFWTNSAPSTGTVMKLLIAGGPPTVLADGQNYPEAMDMGVSNDGKLSVYWVNDDTQTQPPVDIVGRVSMVPTDGGAVQGLGGGAGHPKGIVGGSPTYFLYTSDDQSAILAPDGEGTRPVTTGQMHPYGITRDRYANFFYWVTQGPPGMVMKQDIFWNTSPVPLATDQDQPCNIAADETYVYWTNRRGGQVMAVPSTGGSPITLASGQGAPFGIALDRHYVYFTNQIDGTVARVAKP